MSTRPSSTDRARPATLPKAYRALRVTRHDTRRLSQFPTDAPDKTDERRARQRFAQVSQLLAERQEMLFAGGRHRLLVIFQATDTGGKDGAIRHVFQPMNPAGVRVVAFKPPTRREADHDYLWRIHPHTPAPGEIAVFNRSHYEDVLVPWVRGQISRAHCRRRHRHIRQFERLLTDEGTTIVKFFLHISREEQRKRLQARVDDPRRHWKFHPSDLEERQHWDDYQAAYEELLPATSRRHRPWYVIPANQKWYRNLAVSEILLAELDQLGLQWPAPNQALSNVTVD